MKRSAPLLAIGGLILAAGCGAGEAGGRIASILAQAAQKCALQLAANHARVDAGATAARPPALAVADVETVAPAPKRAVLAAREATPQREIAPIPISRDLSSIRPPCGGASRMLLVHADSASRTARPIVLATVRLTAERTAQCNLAAKS